MLCACGRASLTSKPHSYLLIPHEVTISNVSHLCKIAIKLVVTYIQIWLQESLEFLPLRADGLLRPPCWIELRVTSLRPVRWRFYLSYPSIKLLSLSLSLSKAYAHCTFSGEGNLQKKTFTSTNSCELLLLLLFVPFYFLLHAIQAIPRCILFTENHMQHEPSKSAQEHRKAL